MSDPNDNLENFFRNRVEEGHYEFREEDWAKMEEKLDTTMPVVAGGTTGKLLWMGLGSAITILLMLSYLGIRSLVLEPSPDVAVNPVQEMQQIQKSKENVPSSIESVDTDVQKSSVTQKVQIEAVESETNTSKEQVQVVEKTVVEHNHVVASEDSGQVDQNIAEEVAQPVGIQENKISATDKEVSKVEPIDANPQSASYVFGEYNPGWVSPEKVEQKREIVSRKIWAVSITGALDATRTPESSWGDLQLRYGVYGEYFITPKFSLGAGVNMTEKVYYAIGSEYKPPYGFWTRGIVPDNTFAKCEVLDIPVTANYYIPLGSKSAVRLEGGLSSWLMLTEHYWYNYEQTDPDLIKYWGTKNENQYWFGVLDLAVGYQYHLTKKWAVNVGPYFNMPLKGVGYGNIKLFSAGLKASLQFHKYKSEFK